MTIHISETKQNLDRILKVDGHLKAADVSALVTAYCLEPGKCVLDLSDLQSADPSGLATLRELVSLGVEIHHASPYIELLLKSKPVR